MPIWLLLALGFVIYKSYSASNENDWITDLFLRTYKADNVIVAPAENSPQRAKFDAAAKAAGENGVPIAWVYDLALAGFTNLDSAAKTILNLVKTHGKPASEDAATLAAYKNTILGGIKAALSLSSKVQAKR